MDNVQLGASGPTVSRLGLGCMGMSEFYDSPGEEECIATIHTALERGINFLDTADMYGPFTNEKLVGKAIEDRRDDVVLATKFGIERRDDGTMVGVNGRPEYVKNACHGSLERLGVDTIDLYYCHRVDPDVPIEDTVGAMAELKEQGKIKYLGLSEAAPGTIRRAHRVHPITALQTEYSLWTRFVEDEILLTVRDLDIGFVAYSPLGRGFLTGRITSRDDLNENDWRRENPRFQGDNFQKNLELVEQVKSIADEKDITPAQLALAWLLHQGDDIVPLFGTSRGEHLKENLESVDVELTDEDLGTLESVAPPGIAAGDRYPNMNTVNG